MVGMRTGYGEMHIRRLAQVTIAVALSLTALATTAGPAHGAAGFGDVDAGRYYTTPIQWMTDTGITTGTSPGCFEPDRAVTRAEIATFLHRYANQPPGGAEPFFDVSPGDWYHDPVAWMVATGITTGTTATTFEPDRAVTRAEVATFLHRFAGSPAPAVPLLAGTPFTDIGAGLFFTVAVQWMVGADLTTGTTATTFEPYRAVTRGEAAAFLHRLAGSPNVAIDPGGECGVPIAGDLDLAEAESLSLLNQLRVSVGAAPLTRVAVMDDFARNWSRTMSEGHFFEHSNGPYGENIVWWSNENLSPQQAALQFHQMWVGSPGHYQNMTNAGYRTVGIGLWRDENGWHGTHVFAF